MFDSRDQIFVSNVKDVTLTKILEIKKADKKQKYLNIEELENQNIIIKCQEMELEIKDDRYYIWTGNLLKDPFSIKGSSCHAIQPELKTIEGKSVLCFDRQLILDMNVCITVDDDDSRPEEASTSNFVSPRAVETG